MAAKQLVELNHRHMAIAEFLLQHPHARLHEVAAAVGFSPSWVSIVTNSELFREYMRQRSREVGDSVYISLQEKIQGIAHRAVEKLGDAIDNSQDPAFILAAADKTLHRLGYGAASTQVNVGVNNTSLTVNHVGSEVVESARRKLYELAGVPTGPTAERLPSGSESGRVGKAETPAALVHQAEEGPGPKASGRLIRAQSVEGPRGELRASPSSEPLD